MADEEKKPGLVATNENKPAEAPKPRPRWPLYAAGSITAICIIVVLGIIYIPASSVWTDDAYVTVHYATIAPRISGQIAGVAVEDNQSVRAGQILATIDDRDFRTALAMAEAQLDRDHAQVDDASTTIDRQATIIDEAKAQVDSVAAQLAFAQADQRRYRNLAGTGAGTLQDRQQADKALQQAEAAVASKRAAEDSARRQLPVQEAQRRAAMAAVKSDEAQVEQAKLNLSYTQIRAPMDGIVAERSVQVGNYVAPGTVLMSVVPLDQIYIEANYRELALRHVQPRQPVKIHVDAYDLDVDGVVDSIGPASGAAFAPIEPNNATGNFTKIVQRLPVRILVRSPDAARLLRVGFSVETTIDTRPLEATSERQESLAKVTGR
jgi:membrane fusion protein (multidrug efflux system)